MSISHFMSIVRDDQVGSKHYVVHTTDPRFSMELAPDKDAPDKVGKGIIKRICLPNSWTGDYGKCVKLFGLAQDFFAQTFADPVPKAVTKRISR